MMRPTDHLKTFGRGGPNLTNEAYIIVREAIKAVAKQEGKLFPKEQESHYFALAALAALEKSGYVIQKQAAA